MFRCSWGRTPAFALSGTSSVWPHHTTIVAEVILETIAFVDIQRSCSIEIIILIIDDMSRSSWVLREFKYHVQT
jgi:hypothetical protein